jgi:hypothetical protein
MAARTIALLSLTLCGCSSTVGNGKVQTETRELGGFERVRATGPYEVSVIDARSQKVTVTADSNLLAHIATRIEGDTLVLEVTPSTMPFLTGTMKVLVEVPTLARFETTGSGATSVVLESQGRDLVLTTTGSGATSLTGALGALTSTHSGSGGNRFSGSAASWNATSSGSGSIDAKEFPADKATLNLSGSGSIKATVNGSFNATLTGSGSIDWWGNATQVATQDSGSGRTTRH